MSGQRGLEVLTAGDLFAELVMSGFTSWPPSPGEEVFAEEFCREVGGGAAITACGLAKLGVKVGLVGAVGAADGEWMIERLESQGVNTNAMQRSAQEPTAITVSVSSSTERTFLTYMGANRELSALLKNAGSTGQFRNARHVHLGCAPDPAGVGELFQAIAEAGCTLSVDVGWHPEWLADKRCREALRRVDVFLPNEREAAHMTGEREPSRILEAFRKMGLKIVALKLGAKGAALLWKEEILFCEPIAVTPIDTTGAGDCFDAGFLYAWLRGDDARTCLRAGAICGALSTRAFGGLTGFPTLAEMEAVR
ncbi:MAG: carbohydrate kinase family protein [Acidobacteriota bacterium]|nr:carbohydrate kinase family protein [Acidobacteriota bacterium]